MGDKGYLKEKRENAIAKLLDAEIDFNELLKDQKKILGIFSFGNFLEKNDRKIFKFLLATLDDHVIGKEPKEEVVDEIETALTFLENEDVQGFSDYVANVLSGLINTPFEAYEKQIFLSVLMMFNGLIGKAVDKINAKIEEAEKEIN